MITDANLSESTTADREPVLPSAATPDLREHCGRNDWLNATGSPLVGCPHALSAIFGRDECPGVKIIVLTKSGLVEHAVRLVQRLLADQAVLGLIGCDRPLPAAQTQEQSGTFCEECELSPRTWCTTAFDDQRVVKA